MFRILGSPTTLCDGLTRRELLHVGGLGAFGLTLPAFLKLKADSREPARPPPAKCSDFGPAKACKATPAVPRNFGQSCLCARRLVEAGSKFVTVFRDGFGQFGNCAGDTHNNHYPRMKAYLLPSFDRASPTLLLDETLVIWMSEHGRKPKIDPKPKGAGQHYCSRAYSVALAGCGIARGKIVGSTGKIGGDVRDISVSHKDILVTAFHLLGIDVHTTVPDAQGKPAHIAGDGKVRHEVFG